MIKKTLMIVIIALTGFSLLFPFVCEARGYYGWRGGWGWYAPGAFAGGVAVGAIIARPWYYGPRPVYVYPPPAYVYPPPVVYVYPPPSPVYVPNQAYAYPDPRATSGHSTVVTPGRGSTSSSGQWVEVPGQSVNGTWVPAHKAWVPGHP